MTLARYVIALAKAKLDLPNTVDVLSVEGVVFDGWDYRDTPGAACAWGSIRIGSLPTLDLGDTIEGALRTADIIWHVLDAQPDGRITIGVARFVTHGKIEGAYLAELIRLCPDLANRTVELGPLVRVPDLDDAQRESFARLSIDQALAGQWVLASDADSIRNVFSRPA
ncbi:hypothetical protein EBS80_00080 [bacterium]|nr:hypothetical protein [bacterium]